MSVVSKKSLPAQLSRKEPVLIEACSYNISMFVIATASVNVFALSTLKAARHLINSSLEPHDFLKNVYVQNNSQDEFTLLSLIELESGTVLEEQGLTECKMIGSEDFNPIVREVFYVNSKKEEVYGKIEFVSKVPPVKGANGRPVNSFVYILPTDPLVPFGAENDGGLVVMDVESRNKILGVLVAVNGQYGVVETLTGTFLKNGIEWLNDDDIRKRNEALGNPVEDTWEDEWDLNQLIDSAALNLSSDFQNEAEMGLVKTNVDAATEVVKKLMLGSG